MSYVSIEQIRDTILFIRDHRVMLDSDLAKIYGVSTKYLNQQVRRNIDRFPEDFMFQLTKIEGEFLRLQNATSKEPMGGRRYLPYVYTEHGALMLSAVLNSPVAIGASIQVVRAFMHLRKILSSHVELARKLNAMEKKYDSQFKSVFDAIRQLMVPPEPTRNKIGI